MYGASSSTELGLPPTLTAASFGKLISASLQRSDERPRDEDVAAALLALVAQAAATLAKAYAAPLVRGARERIFFSGEIALHNA